jgi:dTDP-4-amino-4,6-dideoxygalactose transaminase
MNQKIRILDGGDPLFFAPLHVGKPNVGDRKVFLDRVEDILDRKWFTNKGPVVQEFEDAIAKQLGVKHCVAMCNGTVALEIAIKALDIKGEVILPSLTFVATAHACQWQEVVPVFCDVDPETYCLDPGDVEKHITPKTSAILGVHLFGRACDVESLQSIATKNGLELLFDASHAFGCTYKGTPVGRFGRCEVFSFHATKTLNTLEGGAVVTNDDQLAAKLRLMKNFGFDGLDSVVFIGSNGKMNEVSAAMGLTNLESLDTFVAENRRCHNHYVACLKDLPGVVPRTFPAGEKSNFHYMVVEIHPEEAGLSRDEIVEALRSENVLARRYFYPGCHNMEPYRSHYPYAGNSLPSTETLCQRIMCLPVGENISNLDIEKIAGFMRSLMSRSRDVRIALSSSGANEEQ